MFYPHFSVLSPFQCFVQPRSQGLRGETVTKTLVKFILSFQNFGKKIACAVRHNRISIRLNTVVSPCAAIFSQNFEFYPYDFTRVFVTVSPRRPWDRGCVLSSFQCFYTHFSFRFSHSVSALYPDPTKKGTPFYQLVLVATRRKRVHFFINFAVTQNDW